MRSSLREFETDVAAVQAGLSTTLADLARLLKRGQASGRQLQGLSATLEGSRADLRALRKEVGALSVPDWQIGESGSDRIHLWRWQVGLRGALLSTGEQARRAQALVTTLLSGAQPRTYTVRSGETLQSIAQKTLGDWKEWTRLLEVNGLDPAAELASGSVLIIPEKR
jgi:nucleoid-associated protein YgaU